MEFEKYQNQLQHDNFITIASINKKNCEYCKQKQKQKLNELSINLTKAHNTSIQLYYLKDVQSIIHKNRGSALIKYNEECIFTGTSKLKLIYWVISVSRLKIKTQKTVFSNPKLYLVNTNSVLENRKKMLLRLMKNKKKDRIDLLRKKHNQKNQENIEKIIPISSELSYNEFKFDLISDNRSSVISKFGLQTRNNSLIQIISQLDQALQINSTLLPKLSPKVKSFSLLESAFSNHEKKNFSQPKTFANISPTQKTPKKIKNMTLPINKALQNSSQKTQKISYVNSERFQTEGNDEFSAKLQKIFLQTFSESQEEKCLPKALSSKNIKYEIKSGYGINKKQAKGEGRLVRNDAASHKNALTKSLSRSIKFSFVQPPSYKIFKNIYIKNNQESILPSHAKNISKKAFVIKKMAS